MNLLPDKLWLKAALLVSLALNAGLPVFRAASSSSEAIPQPQRARLLAAPSAGASGNSTGELPKITQSEIGQSILWAEFDESKEREENDGFLRFRSVLSKTTKWSESYAEKNGVSVWVRKASLSSAAVDEFGMTETETKRLLDLSNRLATEISILEAQHDGMAPNTESRIVGEEFRTQMIEIFGEERGKALLYLSREWQISYNLCENPTIQYGGSKWRNRRNYSTIDHNLLIPNLEINKFNSNNGDFSPLP